MWQHGIREGLTNFGRIGSSRLRGWNTEDPSISRVWALDDMIMNCEQWRLCIDSEGLEKYV